MKGLVKVEINWSKDALESAERVATQHKIELPQLLKDVMSAYMNVFVDEYEGNNEEFTFKINYEVMDDE